MCPRSMRRMTNVVFVVFMSGLPALTMWPSRHSAAAARAERTALQFQQEDVGHWEYTDSYQEAYKTSQLGVEAAGNWSPAVGSG